MMATLASRSKCCRRIAIRVGILKELSPGFRVRTAGMAVSKALSAERTGLLERDLEAETLCDGLGIPGRKSGMRPNADDGLLSAADMMMGVSVGGVAGRAASQSHRRLRVRPRAESRSRVEL